MKKLITASLVSAALLVSPSSAQETKCFDTESAYARMKDSGVARVFLGAFPQGVLEIWAESNEDGSSWVAFVTLPDGMSCLITEGGVFAAQELPPNI